MYSAVMRNEEEDELSVTEEVLQCIQTEVEKDEQLVHRRMQLSQVEQWLNQKERETSYTRQLYNSAYESVLECESVIKGLYGMLGLEYRDTDSEEEGEAKPMENVIQITDNDDKENEVEDISVYPDDYVVIDLGAALPSLSLEKKSKCSSQVDELSPDVQVSSTQALGPIVKKPVTVKYSLTSNSTLLKDPVTSVNSLEEMDASLPVKTRESPVPISSSPPADALSSTTFIHALETKREISPSRSPEPSSGFLLTIKTRESPVAINSPPSPNVSSPKSFRPICVPKTMEGSPSEPPSNFFPTIKTRESPVSISNIPLPDNFCSSAFKPITSTKKERLEPSNNLTIKTRESPVSISSTPSPVNLPSIAFIPISSPTKKDIKSSRSPERSNSLTIKTRESPIPINNAPSPDVSSSVSTPVRNSTPKSTEPSELTDAVASAIPSEPLDDAIPPKTVASKTAAKQNLEAAAQLEISAKMSRSSTESFLGSTKRVSLNQRQVCSSSSSHTLLSNTAGKITATEKAKVTSSTFANRPSTSVTSSTATQSTHTTKASTSCTTVSSQPSVADTATSAKPSTPAPTSTTTSAKPSDNKEASQATPARVQKEVELKVNMDVLGRRRTKTWHQGTILEIRKTDTGNRYKIKFEGDKGKSMLSGHHLACVNFPMLKDLFVGCRVVARYKEDDQSWLHSAVITEMPDRKNRMRFMVFYDDGRSAYVSLPDLHLVCMPLKNMYDDIEDEMCRTEVVEYLQAFPNPIFVVVRVTQDSKVERDGQWEDCTITQVDGSLVQICYKKDKQKEWLYKGSNRLAHIQRIKKKMVDKKTDQPSNRASSITDQRSTTTTTTAASVMTTTAVVTTTASEVTKQIIASQPSAPQSVPQADAASTITAKKDAMLLSEPKIILERISIPKASPPTLHPEPTATSAPNKGTKRRASAELDIYQSAPLPVFESRLKYLPHRCCPACLDQVRPPQKDQYHGQNPLRVPLLYGFRRMTARRRLEGKMSFHVFYRAPCGRSLCEMEEVQDFLCETRCDFLFLEMFCLDPFVLVKRALPPSSMTNQPYLYLPDYAEGKEVVPVPCVNELNSSRPAPLQYTKHRVPAPGVSINTSLDFMVGCDCTDGCRDRSKCSCHQLTIEATSLFTDGPVDVSVGYTHKRLTRCVPTGVYECNPLCRCDPWTCSNRLVQHGQQLRLQLFMTQHKGWGIRCLDDVSKGTFVCVFTGKIVTDDMASTEATMSGNEYLVNLDYIEGVEKMKEGYESEAYCSDTEAHSEKRSIVTMTTGSSMKHGLFTRDSSSGEEMEMPKLQKIEGIKKFGRRKSETDDSSDNDVDLDDDMDDEDYTVSSDDNVEMRPSRSVDNCQRSYITRRNAKIMNAQESLLNDVHPPLPLKVTEEKTEVSSAMAKQMRNDGPGESGLGFARKSTRNFAVKSSHRRVKPPEVEKEKAEKKTTACGRRNTRSLFSNEEACYLIDTKQEGNIARFINHSCSPNLFVQNVFVDTHDLRFPWVAFFTSKRIKAGTELTWDYSYEVGSVEGKVLLCCCGSADCTGRLL